MLYHFENFNLNTLKYHFLLIIVFFPFILYYLIFIIMMFHISILYIHFGLFKALIVCPL